MSESTANALLARARKEKTRLRRHLLVAAALRELLPDDPVVVGGTAEEFWTADDYHQTDLDICVPWRKETEGILSGAGFQREGRHWFREDIAVAVEFPDTRIDGDPARTVLESIEEGAARIIGVDDLYVDRLRQSTMREPDEGIEFHSALAVAAACFDRIDWKYVARRIRDVRDSEKMVGDAMRRVDSRIRRRVRRSVTE